MNNAKTKLDLPAILIQPVQRMPRYQLLLQQLVKLTPEEHVDRANLEAALAKFTEMNVYINKRKKEEDNRKRMEEVKRSIQGLAPVRFLTLVLQSLEHDLQLIILEY